MSLPTIPDITPKIDISREDVKNLLLASIALEEIGLSHIINAEGQKIETLLASKPDFNQMLLINNSVQRTLRTIIQKQIVLQLKLEDVISISEYSEDCLADC